MDPKQLRQIINEEVTGIVKTELAPIEKRLERVENKVDALSGDIEKLHDDVKGIRDTEGLFHSRNKREIDEIKKHLDLPIIPDAPQI